MNYLITSLFVLISVSVLGQDFSGEIVYENFECKVGESFEARFASTKNTKTSKYLISGDTYKFSKYENDTFELSYTYDKNTKNLIDEKAGQSHLTFRSSQKNYGTPKDITIPEDSTITILGYKCYPVILEYDNYIMTKYYSRDIRIPYHAYKDHNLGYWYDCLKLTDGGITLRTITQYEDKVVVSNALAVTRRELEKSEIRIPKNKRLVASGYDLENPPKLNQPNQDQIQCYRSKLLYGQSLIDREIISTVGFIVTKDGTIEEVKIESSHGPSIDEVTMDIFNNCGLSFSPGKLDGQEIDSKHYFAVKYTPLNGR